MNPIPQAPINDMKAEPADQNRPVSDGYSAPDIPSLAWNKKWWIALAAGIGLLLGQLAYMKFGPMYESRGEILVARNSITPIRERDGDPINVGDRGEHIALILSPLIIDNAVKKGQLDQLPSIKGGPRDPSREIIDFLKVRRRAGQDRSVLNVLELTYISPRRGDGPKVVQSVIDAYRDYLKEARNESAAEVSNSYEEAKQLQQQKLDEIENAQMRFRETTPLLWKTAPGVQGSTADLTNVEQEKLLKIDLDRRDVQSKKTEVESKIRTLEEAIEKNDPPAVLEFLVRRMINMQGGAADQNRIWESISTRLVPLIDQEQKLIAQGYDEGFPELKALRVQIQAVRDFYRRQGVILPEERPVAKVKEGQSLAQAEIVLLYVASLKKEKTELENRLTALDELYRQTFTKAKEYAALLLEDQKFNDEIRALKENSFELNKKRNGIELSQNNGGYSMKQIAPVSEEIQAKRYIQFLGMGAIFLMTAAFGLFYIRTMQDNTIKSIEDLRTRFGLHAIGQIPQFDVSKIQTIPGSQLDPSMIYVHRSGSHVAEAYRSLRTALFFATQGQRNQVIQITSAEPNDGKTTLSGNLAAAIANSGRSVLLIDGDLRRPRIHECFGDQQRPGLADVLVGHARSEDVIHTTEIPGLSLMCSGTIPANPSEILGSTSYDELIMGLRKKYDFILIDSPPILAVSDPCVLSRQSDGMLIVFRQGKNRLSTVRQTVELVRGHGINLLGAVFNGVELPELGVYGYSYKNNEYLSDSERKPQGPTSIPLREPVEV